MEWGKVTVTLRALKIVAHATSINIEGFPLTKIIIGILKHPKKAPCSKPLQKVKIWCQAPFLA